jgi:hypothetical protein
MSLGNLAGLIVLVVALGAIIGTALAIPAVRPVLKRALAQPSFLIVTVVLLTAALGLNAAVSFMQLHFKKEPVPLVRPLGSIPEKFGTWVQVSQDQPLDHEIQDVLGTDQYIFRDYVDESVLGPGVIARFRDKSNNERREILAGIRAKSPTAVVSLSVTYYTGMVDTVAHVPDRCVTADGYEPKSYETPRWPIARYMPATLKPGGVDDVEVRYINFEDQTGASNVTRSISYFFHTNGKFISSPLGVRHELADLFQKKGYYAKIEVMTTIDNKEESARVMTDFLTNALPEVQKCMPDWAKQNGGGGESKPAEQVAAK